MSDFKDAPGAALAAEGHLGLAGYLLTYLALVVLAALSLALSFLHLARGEIILALLIASLKAGLVLWYFMPLDEETLSSRVAILVALLLCVLLVTLPASDVATRYSVPRGPSPTAGNPFYL